MVKEEDAEFVNLHKYIKNTATGKTGQLHVKE